MAAVNQTSDFFEPDREYVQDAPFRAPEVVMRFRCVTVAMHPSKGEMRAFGFATTLNQQDCMWYSFAMAPENWAERWLCVGALVDGAWTT